jgi:hypothetical protein
MPARGDVDDRAAAVRHHATDGDGGGQGGSAHVKRQQFAHLDSGGCHEIAEQSGSSVVHEKINRWLGAQTLTHRIGLCNVGQIGRGDRNAHAIYLPIGTFR